MYLVNESPTQSCTSFSTVEESKILPSWNHANSVCVTLASTPSLNADDQVIFTKYPKIDGIMDTPLKSAINIFLPVSFAEVRLFLWVQEWVNAPV